MKILRAIAKIISGILIIFPLLMMPLTIYILYCVIWGGAVEGEVIAPETFAPTKILAITQFAIIITIFILGLVLDHYGIKAIDKLIKKEQNS